MLWDQARSTGKWRLRLAVLLAILLFPGLVEAQQKDRFDPDDLIIFYGGVGYLSKQAQPALAAIIDGQTRGEGAGASTLAMTAYRQVVRRRHSMSSYDVVTGDESLKSALAANLGVSSDEISGDTIAAQLQDETNLVLSVIGSFEVYVPLVKDTSQGDFAEKHYITAVTALLSQAGSGRIILAAPALSELVVREAHRGEETHTIRFNRFSKAYETAIKRALDGLWKLGGRFAGGYPELDMVTRVSVKDPATRALFGVKAASAADHGDLCSQPPSCALDDQICHAMIGLLAQGVTEQLANAGRAMLPPAQWAVWGDSAREQLKLNASVLRINSAGGLRQLDDQLTLVLDPAFADRKVDVTLTGIQQVDTDGQTKYVSYRGYKAYLKADWTAAPGGCSPGLREAGGRYVHVTNAMPVSQIRGAEEKGRPPALAYQQGYGIVAVMNALKAMAGHVTKLGFLPLLLVGLLPAAAAQAAVVPVVASGVAETGEDETACYEAAVRDALMKAIGQTMEGMPGAEKAQVDLPALARDRSIVKSVKLREKAKNILGQCEVSLRTVLDKGRLRDFVEGRLSTSLDLQSNRLSAIGAVMRFLVDSKVAEDAGFDTKEALTALGQALRNYNVRLVNLDPVATVFARQEIPQWQAVTGDGMAEGTVKGDSAQAAQFVREAVHQALHMSLGEFDQVELQSFDLLLTGQSDVRYLGPDPQGPGHIAEVSSYLELVAVNGLATVATTTSTGRQKGPSREAAIRRAMIDSLEGNAAALAAQIDKALRDLRKYGRAYNVVVTNITSNRKQLRPLIAGLQAGGATLVEGRSDGDGISKFNIAYRGEISALESLLGRVLDDMARDFPSVDYRINGNVIEVSF